MVNLPSPIPIYCMKHMPDNWSIIRLESEGFIYRIRVRVIPVNHTALSESWTSPGLALGSTSSRLASSEEWFVIILILLSFRWVSFKTVQPMKTLPGSPSWSAPLLYFAAAFKRIMGKSLPFNGMANSGGFWCKCSPGQGQLKSLKRPSSVHAKTNLSLNNIFFTK